MGTMDGLSVKTTRKQSLGESDSRSWMIGHGHGFVVLTLVVNRSGEYISDGVDG